MKVILLENVKNIGRAGEVKEVSDGYARNFLFPKKLAQMATSYAIQEVEAKNKKIEEELKNKEKEFRELAEKISGQKIVFKSKGKNGKLFGSISAKEIAQKMIQEGFNVNEENIILKGHIKEIGEHEVKIKLGQNIEAKIKLQVEEDK